MVANFMYDHTVVGGQTITKELDYLAGPLSLWLSVDFGLWSFCGTM